MDRYSDVKNNYFAVWERHTEYREIDEEKRNGTRYIWMHGKAFGGNEIATEWTLITEHWTVTKFDRATKSARTLMWKSEKVNSWKFKQRKDGRAQQPKRKHTKLFKINKWIENDTRS